MEVAANNPGGSMENRYCGACRGERGCKDCKTALGKVKYESLTEFSVTGFSEENDFGNEIMSGTDCAVSGAFVVPEALFLVADIGTTTLAFVCADATGTVLASYGAQNPQRMISADVIGRIDAACHGAAEELKIQIREALAKGFLFVLERGIAVLREAGKCTEKKKVQLALAGNTTMQHLLLRYPVEGMAKHPFTPYSQEAVTVRFSELFAETTVYERFSNTVKEAEVFVFPCLSAFVGGDVLAGAYGLSFPGVVSETKARTPGNYLLADLGTNGELFLSVKGKIYATAAAMGTAFEGGRFAYASDLFSLTASALEEGAADETGLLAEPYFTEGFHGLMQEDIRTFQLAKGALRAGIELLCKHAGISAEQVDTVFLAGGAGRYCRVEDLLQTGCLPKVFAGKVKIVGNSCIGGLLCYLKKPEIMIQCKGEVLNLATEPEFEEIYYRSMEFWDEES